MENILSLPLQRSTPIKDFFDTCANALFSPTRFFREQFSKLSTAELIVLGLVSGWIASFVALLWASMNDIVLSALLQDWMRGLLASDESLSLFSYSGKDFLLDVALTLLFPFWALLRMVFAATLLWVFARLLISQQIPNREVDWKSCFRIVAAASIGRWFCVVPVLGSLLGVFAVVVLMINGVHQYFQVSYRRAGFIVLLPSIAVAAFILFALFLIGFMVALELPQLLGILT